ncbi:MAG: alpha/beta hydrolase [Acidimicrobiia bacterium]
MLSALFFIGSLIGALLTSNGLRRRSLWLPAMITNELPLHHIVWQAVVVGLFAWGGVLDHILGRIALAITLASWAGLLVMAVWSVRARPTMAAALAPMGLKPGSGSPPTLSDIVRVRGKLPRGVEAIRGIAYGPEPAQLLDIHRPGGDQSGLPVLLQIHGGGWMRGHRERESRPLIHRMAAAGWVCASMDYRLSPAATFPDHLIDVKLAISWLRANEAEHGGDSSFVALSGGSAGAHLAGLAALTPDDLAYQPGFASADTSVQACVTFYGIHDLLDRNRIRYPWPFVESRVMKVSPDADPEAWNRASPLTQVGPHAPPFLVMHGSHDSLVPPDESRQFVAALRAVSQSPVLYAEIPGGTHGFDFFHSLRSRHVVRGVESFLNASLADHKARNSHTRSTEK